MCRENGTPDPLPTLRRSPAPRACTDISSLTAASIGLHHAVQDGPVDCRTQQRSSKWLLFSPAEAGLA